MIVTKTFWFNVHFNQDILPNYSGLTGMSWQRELSGTASPRRGSQDAMWGTGQLNMLRKLYEGYTYNILQRLSCVYYVSYVHIYKGCPIFPMGLQVDEAHESYNWGEFVVRVIIVVPWHDVLTTSCRGRCLSENQLPYPNALPNILTWFM